MRRDEISQQEKEAFIRKVRESEKKRQEQEAQHRAEGMLEARDFDRKNYEQQRIEERRERLVGGFGFSAEDKKVLTIFQNQESRHNLYLSMYYLFVAFDHRTFVEKGLSRDMNIKTKFYYVFGADLEMDTLPVSKKTVLYQICKKLSDRMGQAQGSQDQYAEMESLNQYLALIGCLSLAVPYEQSFLSNNFTLGFDPNKTGSRYCVMIPPKDIESELFKDVYEFYMNNITRVVMKDIHRMKQPDAFTRLATEKAEESGVFSRLNRAVMEDYEAELSIKLDSLRKKGGSY